MKSLVCIVVVVYTVITSSSVIADPVSIKALFTAPQESIKMEFDDGSKHFVLMVRREGSAEGSGPIAGAFVTEWGWHDVNPPVEADALGYFQFTTADGDIAIIKWSLRAVFLKGDAKPRLTNTGSWELVSGTGQFKGMTGVGTLTLKMPSKTDTP